MTDTFKNIIEKSIEKDNPCLMPTGTIRSILALVIIVGAMYMAIKTNNTELASFLAGSVLAHYFDSRSGKNGTSSK